MLSKSTEYGIKALIYLCRYGESKRIGLKDIAASIDSPEAFTSKILQKLVKAEIIDSSKGQGGGFRIIPERKNDITVWDIVKSIEGDSLQNHCVLGLSECNSEYPCPAHDEYSNVRGSFLEFFKKTSISSLAQNWGKGLGELNY